MASGIDSAAQSVSTWTDLSGFNGLRKSAQADSKAALPVVARQFESIFTQMVLKSMRDANFGDPNFDSQASDSWQGLADQQLAVTLSAQGHGLGIAQMLVRQLGGKAAEASGSTPSAVGGPSAGTASVEDWRARLGSVTQAVGAAAQTASHFIPGDPVDFVTRMAPFAAKAAHKLGVSVRAVLAQAALETQWGQHMPQHVDGSPSYNLFGMKAGASWNGGSVSVPTLEVEGGVPVRRRAQFRAYASPAQSFEDYARLLGDNPRYAQALGKGDDVAGFAQGLVSGGYATDPAYAAKLARVADSPAMHQALDALKNTVGSPISHE